MQTTVSYRIELRVKLQKLQLFLFRPCCVAGINAGHKCVRGNGVTATNVAAVRLIGLPNEFKD